MNDVMYGRSVGFFYIHSSINIQSVDGLVSDEEKANRVHCDTIKKTSHFRFEYDVRHGESIWPMFVMLWSSPILP